MKRKYRRESSRIRRRWRWRRRRRNAGKRR
jgi:hypothetical protein